MPQVFSEHGVVWQVEDALGLITLADPDGNRLSLPRLTALKKALGAGMSDPAIRVLLLRGGAPGKPWCLGMDLDVLGKSVEVGSEGADARGVAVAAYGEVLTLIHGGPKPVLALVGGPVMAGGVGLAAACDGVFATHAASFELSEVYYGLIPANVIPFLMARMAPQKIKYLVLSARKLNAVEAWQGGLVDDVFQAEDVESSLRKALRNFLRAEPGASKATKEFMGWMDAHAPEERLPHAQKTILGLMAGESVGHALGAFQKGETPRWFAKPATGAKLFFPG